MDIKNHIESYKSFTVSGVENRGEGADFIHEATNRKIKSFLPPGIPTPEVWKRVTRNATSLDQMKDSITSDAAKPPTYRYKRFDREVTILCQSIRFSGIASSPYEGNSIRSVDGKILDYDLCNIKQNAYKNYESYKNELAKTKKYPKKPMIPIFITPEDRAEYDDIYSNSKTKDDIIQMIREINPLVTLKSNLKKDELVAIYLEEQAREEEERARVAAIEEEGVEDQVEEEDEIVL